MRVLSPSRSLIAGLVAWSCACGGSPPPVEPHIPQPADTTNVSESHSDHTDRHDGGTEAKHGPLTTPRVTWRAQTQGRIVATAMEAQASGDIVVGSLDGALYRFNKDGALVFRLDTGAPIHSSTLAVGPRSDSHVIATNARGDVMRVDATGNVVWRISLASPIVVDPIQASTGHILVAADGIYAIDEHGRLHWHHVEATTIYGAPLKFPPGLVYGTIDGRVVALDDHGHERWTTRLNAAVTEPMLPRYDGTIAINAGGKQHVLTTDGVLVSMTELAAEPSATIDSEGNRYFVTPDHLLVATQGDGTLLWRYSLGANVAGSVLLTSTGTLVVGADDGILYALH